MAYKTEETRQAAIARLNSLESREKREKTQRDPEHKSKVAQKREKIKNFNLLAKYMMEAEIPDEDEALEELREHGFQGADYQTAVFWGQLKKAIYGLDTEAAKYVRDTAGYKPREGLDIGNLDDKPFTQIDLSKLSNEELMAMIAKRETIEE